MRMLTVALSVVSAVCTPCFAEESENAALWYWRAFAMNPALMMNHDSPLNDHLREMDSPNWKLSPEAESSITALDEIIDEFVRGAEKATCDFGVDRSQGPYALLPHISPMRLLTRATLANTQMCLKANQPDRATTLVVACLRASHHLSGDGPTVSSIVSTSMLKTTLATINLGQDSNTWDDSHLKAILEELTRFNKDDPTQLQRATISSQRSLIEWMRADHANGGHKTREFVSSGASLGQDGSIHQDQRSLKVTPTMLDQYAQFLDAADKAWSVDNPGEAIAELEQRIGDDEFGPLTHRVAESLRRPLRERDEVATHLAETRDRLNQQLQAGSTPSEPKASPSP